MKSAGWLACLLAAIIVLAGCDKDKPKTDFGEIKVDSSFSLNVTKVPKDWPDELTSWDKDELIAAQQQKLYEEKGAPDYFLLKWHPDGSPVTAHEYETASWMHRDDKKENPFRELPDIAWIYLDEGIVYSFSRRSTKEDTLNDPMRIICEYGDPYEIKDLPGPNGAEDTIYQYYDIGKIFYFRDNHLYDQQSTPRLEGFTRRR